ncbi:MAG TPA: hypothetical protein EYG94_09860 [Campylobacterales bacterium]|nr:hypothetical protein [Campylobacterales bacterium]
MKLKDEPSLSTIDDYDNNASPEKRKTIQLVIGGLILFIIVFGVIKAMNSEVSDYIGTSESPGIDISRK